ncbi:MAG: hypothetical protein QME49_06025 [bacterium]|nr:hypothetical protein [bacterium]
MYTSKPLSGQKGMALALTLFFLLLLVIGGIVFFVTSQTEIKHGSSYERRLEALSVAESAAERAIWKLGSEDWVSCKGEWDRNFGGDRSLPPVKIKTGQYMRVSFPEKIFEGSDYANVKFTASGIIGREQGGKVISVCTKQIEIIVRVDRNVATRMPKVFDYAYFLNNWGWWYYAGGEQCPGSMRSNGRFDFKKIYGNFSPWKPSEAVTVNGNVEAHLDVTYLDKYNRTYLPAGLAGLKTPPPDYATYPYAKPSLKKEPIPNMQTMKYYEDIAKGYDPYTKTYNHPLGKISIGSKVFVDDGVFGDDEPHENLILIGTKDSPIEIRNSVAIKGNLIMKGYVKTFNDDPGKLPYASVYVGRNMYIAGDIEYVNGPEWSAYPQWQKSSGTDYKYPDNTTLNIADNDDGLPGTTSAHPLNSSPKMDKWVENNSTNKNLLSVAAKGGLVYGDYSSNTWYSNYWLFKMGSEDVGADGIPGTKDAGEGDGIFQRETEDLDGDGEFRKNNYGWKDISTTGGNSNKSEPLQNFDGLRRDGKKSGPLWDPMEKKEINHYAETATNMISNIDGVYYTQHFLGGRVANSPKFRGSLIGKDEAIVYSGTLQLMQDTRYHSNYRADPNFPIYLFPPGSLMEEKESEVLGKFQNVVSWREK